jgi:hypothetical protein
MAERRRPRANDRRRSREGVSGSSDSVSPEHILAFDWPPFFAPDDASFLVERVREAALDEDEQLLFTTVLRAAYEQVLELEILYRELPGVLTDDAAAVETFRATLDYGFRTGVRGGPPFRNIDELGLKPIPDGGGPLPCELDFMVKPHIGFLILNGIERVAGGDRELFERYVDVFGGLWARTSYLDSIYEQARRGANGKGRDRLGELLRVLARDSTPAVQEREAHVGGAGPLALIGDVGTEDGGFSARSEWPPRPVHPGLDLPPLGGRGGFDFCRLVKEACKWMVFGGISGFRHVPVSTYLDDIGSLSPTAACVGDAVTISPTPGKSFPASRPPGVQVLVGTTAVPIDSWSASAIVIRIPQGCRSGCVGFIDVAAESVRLDAMRQNSEAMESISEGLRCLGVAGGTGKAFTTPLASSAPPCAGFNFLQIGPPVVEWFQFLGVGAFATPGTNLVLSWKVSGSASVRIRQTSAGGPATNPNIAHPSTGTLALGPFTGSQPVTASYELTATNSCGSTTARVSVQLQQPPALSIVGIEVVQTIQTPTNTVSLVSGKRTMVRVYVDSGITNGFNSGSGANNQPNVTGDVTVFPAAAGMGFGAGPPLNPGAAIVARPPAAINRNLFSHSLNFELPLAQVSGNVRIDARVWVVGHEQDVGGPWRAFRSLTVTFSPQGAQTVTPVLIADRRLGNPPPIFATQYVPTLSGALPRFPLPEGGFTVDPPQVLLSDPLFHNLATLLGWQLLLLDLRTLVLIGGVAPRGIRSGMVASDPRNAASGVLGIGTTARAPALDWPSYISMPFDVPTLAHEMTHTFNINHAPCGIPATETPEPGLPARTEAPGANVPARLVVPAGTPEQMCGTATATDWPSTVLWGLLRTRIPLP